MGEDSSRNLITVHQCLAFNKLFLRNIKPFGVASITETGVTLR